MDLRPYPPALAEAIAKAGYKAGEVRMYLGRPARVALIGGGEYAVRDISAEDFRETVSRLMEHSLYAVEDELARGFFTLRDGSRVGVCGDLICEGGAIRAMGEISSVCVRIAREMRGCAESLRKYVLGDGGILVVSPPGMGKTTLLRDMARMASDGGNTVCVADERGELAAAVRGAPALDVGARTDVYSHGDRARAVEMAVRSMSPKIIVTDEIGTEADADAVTDAARCGVRVFASAHGGSLDIVKTRRAVARMLGAGAFQTGVLLGVTPGNIVEIREF